VVERIGDARESSLKTSDNQVYKEAITDHTAALDTVLRFLRDSGTGDVQDVRAVGHRVVHGKHIKESLLVNSDVIEAIKHASDLAPLHNPANLEGIMAVYDILPKTPQVAVFDTAFHQTMPPRAYQYALPYELYRERGLQRYGAHGTSVQYLVKKAAELLQRPAHRLNLIVAHLGAGASLTAVEGGKTLDTSMGLTPLEGLMMGTRCGDLDCSAVLYLQRHCGLSIDQCDELLNKKSGFLGLSGQSDLRSVMKEAESGNERAELALQVFVHRVRKYLGAYMVHLKGKVDAIVFSAGLGENSAYIRHHALLDLQAFGIELDPEKNEATVKGRTGSIESGGSGVKVLVIPTDEELCIAELTLEVVSRM